MLLSDQKQTFLHICNFLTRTLLAVRPMRVLNPELYIKFPSPDLAWCPLLKSAKCCCLKKVSSAMCFNASPLD